MLVLEELERAVARGAAVYAEVLGYGTSNDAHHMAQPDPESVGVAEMMRAALRRAGLEPEQVGYINAHGTSTPQGDLAETNAIKDVFGAHAYELAVSSTKSVLGHIFGAAGAVEALMCVRALADGVLPPTINYRNPDPACDLDYVPNEARTRAGRRRALERDGPRRAQRLRPSRPHRRSDRSAEARPILSRGSGVDDGQSLKRWTYLLVATTSATALLTAGCGSNEPSTLPEPGPPVGVAVLPDLAPITSTERGDTEGWPEVAHSVQHGHRQRRKG